MVVALILVVVAYEFIAWVMKKWTDSLPTPQAGIVGLAVILLILLTKWTLASLMTKKQSTEAPQPVDLGDGA